MMAAQAKIKADPAAARWSMPPLCVAEPVQRLNAWLADPAAGDCFTYAAGPQLPRHAPVVVLVRALADEGRVAPVSKRCPAGWQFMVQRIPVRPDAIRTPMAARLLAALESRAMMNLTCPTNAELAEVFGLPDAKAASYLFRVLVARGDIAIELGAPGHRRIVTIVRNGRKTSPGAL